MDKNGHEFSQTLARDGTGNGTKPARTGRRSEQDRTADLLNSLPVGIQIGTWRDGRAKQFFVRWGKERRVESFENEQSRNDAAEKVAGDTAAGGSDIMGLDVAEWREWRAFRARCKAPLSELEVVWNKHGPSGTSLLLSDAVPRFLALRLTEDLVEKSDSYSHLKLHLGRLVAAYGPQRLDDITADLLRELLGGLINPDTGESMGKVTKRQHRKSWNTFFKRAVGEKWCATNPCAIVVPPKAMAQDKVPLRPREIFDLLKANRDRPVAGRLVFELFGGLRCASVERLRPEDVKRKAKGIRLPGAVENADTGDMQINHKSEKTVYRQGHPDVLWAWVDHVGDAMWTEITEKNYDEKKKAAFDHAGVVNPGNVLRDSFASYLMALTKNVPLVSYLMQHTNIKTTLIYEGVADEDDARLVMAMTPKAVAMTWERFVRSVSKK